MMKKCVLFLCVAALLFCMGCSSETTVKKRKNNPTEDEVIIVATIGQHQLTLQDFCYYYIDAVNEFGDGIYSVEEYADSLGLSVNETIMTIYGIDVKKTLSELTNEETGGTYAEELIQQAMDNATRDFALCDAAEKAGFELPAEDQEYIDGIVKTLEDYASWMGYPSAQRFLRDAFGYGKYATVSSYVEYCKRCELADAYYEYYAETMTYDDAALRAAENGKPEDYNTYSYTYYPIYIENYLEEGITSETATEEHKETACTAAEAEANELALCTTVEEFEEKVAMMDGEVIISSGVQGSSSKEEFRDWFADAKEGNSTVIEKYEDGELIGYYVVYLTKKTDNTRKMVSVRHLLVEIMDIEDEAEWETARTKAYALKTQWETGNRTEESFAELVKNNTDDAASAETGGLYKDIHENSNYVEAFLNWSVDPGRKPGDIDVIQTEYGFHVMYFVENQEMSYRDYLLTTKICERDLEAWEMSLISQYAVGSVDLARFDPDMISLDRGY